MKKLIEELNTQLFDDGEFDHGLLYKTDGFEEFICFNNVVLWSSETNDIAQIDVKSIVKDNFNYYISHISNLRFNYGKSKD